MYFTAEEQAKVQAGYTSAVEGRNATQMPSATNTGEKKNTNRGRSRRE